METNAAMAVPPVEATAHGIAEEDYAIPAHSLDVAEADQQPIGALIEGVELAGEDGIAVTALAEDTPEPDAQEGQGGIRQSLRRSRLARTVAGAAVVAAGIFSANVAPAMANSSQENSGFGATLSYVDEAVATSPLARELIKAFRHAKHSERHIKRHTSEMDGMSYRNVTELSVTVPARVAFRSGRVARSSLARPGITTPAPTLPNHPHKGTYTYVADFKGRIAPKDLVALSIGTSQNTSDHRGVYGFSLERTTKDGPLAPADAIGMHWLMLSSYARNPRNNALYSYASCTAESGIDLRHPIMTEPILNDGLSQAMRVLKLAEKHRPIKRQKDVLASQQPAQSCP